MKHFEHSDTLSCLNLNATLNKRTCIFIGISARFTAVQSVKILNENLETSFNLASNKMKVKISLNLFQFTIYIFFM